MNDNVINTEKISSDDEWILADELSDFNQQSDSSISSASDSSTSSSSDSSISSASDSSISSASDSSISSASFSVVDESSPLAPSADIIDKLVKDIIDNAITDLINAERDNEWELMDVESPIISRSWSTGSLPKQQVLTLSRSWSTGNLPADKEIDEKLWEVSEQKTENQGKWEVMGDHENQDEVKEQSVNEMDNAPMLVNDDDDDEMYNEKYIRSDQDELREEYKRKLRKETLFLKRKRKMDYNDDDLNMQKAKLLYIHSKLRSFYRMYPDVKKNEYEGKIMFNLFEDTYNCLNYNERELWSLKAEKKNSSSSKNSCCDRIHLWWLSIIDSLSALFPCFVNN